MTFFYKNKLLLNTFLIFLFTQSMGSPIGKGLACQNNDKLDGVGYSIK